MKYVKTIIAMAILLILVFYLDSKWVVFVSAPSLSDNSLALSIQEYDHVFRTAKNDYGENIRIYHSPGVGRKSCLQIDTRGSQYLVIRKFVMDDTIGSSGREQSDSSVSEIKIDTLLPSSAGENLNSLVKQIGSSGFFSERRVRILSRKPVVYPDEDVFYLERKVGARAQRMKWFAESGKWIELTREINKLESITSKGY